VTGVTGIAASADRQALVPMLAGYLILMAALAFGLWRMYRPGKRGAGGPPGGPQAGPAVARRGSGRAAMARLIVSTVVGGYLLLFAAVVAYYYGVARIGGNFLESAATGTALLIGLAAPVFAAASWLTWRPWRRRRP
jgi:hypothetical protein